MNRFGKFFTMILLTALVLSGCGKAGGEEKAPAGTEDQAAETSAAGEPAETAQEADETPARVESGSADTPEAEEAEDNEEEVQEELTPDPTNLSYLEEIQIEDFYGDGAKYPLYMPKDGINEDGFFYYNEHGVTFTANVFNFGDPRVAAEALQTYMKEIVDQQVKDWKDDPDCTDVGVGEMLEKGDDRYLFITATAKDFNGVPYQKTMLIYMSVREGGAGVFWDMEVEEFAQDEETMALIEEVGRCYGIHLDELVMEDGEWASRNEQRMEDEQDVYEPEEGEPVLEKVEGYQYLGMVTITVNEEGNVTCPVLAPMGRNTAVSESSVSASIHGVSVRVHGENTGSTRNYQSMAREDAAWDLKFRSDPEEGNRNVRVSEVMPMKGQEAGAYYAIEYEEKDRKTEEYHKRADVNCYIQVKEKHFVMCNICLRSGEYDNKTNIMIKELETAYGIDLSEWYADEEALQAED